MKKAAKRMLVDWFEIYGYSSLELMKGYSEGVERQAEFMVRDFNENKKIVSLDESPEENDENVVEEHYGLIGGVWDLEHIFLNHFPNLHRQSALIALFSYFEHELDQLCRLFEECEKFNISVGDLKGTGIERSSNYLEKVVQLNIDKGAHSWAEIKSIQKLRNLIVHNQGVLLDSDGNLKKVEAHYVEKSKLLSGNENYIAMKNGFLAHVLSVFEAQFEQIDIAIRSKYTS